MSLLSNVALSTMQSHRISCGSRPHGDDAFSEADGGEGEKKGANGGYRGEVGPDDDEIGAAEENGLGEADEVGRRDELHEGLEGFRLGF